MSDPYMDNTIRIARLEMLIGEAAELEAAEAVFAATPGDFATKFTAVMRERVTRGARPEVFIEIPKDPSVLRRAELEALVRPVADGFLRSYPTKGELLDQVARIERRQRSRPAWIPKIDSDGRPLDVPEPDGLEYVREPDRPVVVSSLHELGDVTILGSSDPSVGV